MDDSPIRSVADTAFWVATYRADESARGDALFRDPLAARLVEGRGREIAAKMPRLALAEWLVVIRTCIIDDFVRDAVRAGADTVLNLGAGLDTRPYRLDLPAPLRWIEVDFAGTIAFKSERLAGETPRCALERVSVDLGDAGARRALLAKVAAESRRVFVLTEGVIPYLSNDAVAALADELSAAPCFGAWTLEYMTPLADRTSRRMRSHIRFARAPFQFQPGDWRGFFRAHGWEIAELRYLVEEGERRERRPPITWAQRMMLSLASPEKRKALREMRGFAVLAPRSAAPTRVELALMRAIEHITTTPGRGVKLNRTLAHAARSLGTWSEPLQKWLDDEEQPFTPEGIELLLQMVRAVRAGILIEGQGNYGGPRWRGETDQGEEPPEDALPPAHPRFLECRLTPKGIEVLREHGEPPSA